MSKSSRTFYCTCQIVHKATSNGKFSDRRHLKFHVTKVDEEECCVHCGYYAWESPQHKLYPRRALVPWRDEVCDQSGWTGNTELRDAYFNKTVYSDHDLDLGAAYNELPGSKGLREKSTVEELCSVYVGWGGSSNEG